MPSEFKQFYKPKSTKRKKSSKQSAMAMRYLPAFKQLGSVRTVPVDLRPGGFITPTSATVILPYYETANLAPGIPASDYQFNLNSIFDPNRTGTGHQPLGHDQWASFYGRYRVIGVDVRLNIQNTGTVMVNGSLIANNSTTALTGFNAYEEEMIRLYEVGAVSGEDTTVVTCYIDLAKVVGRTKSQYESDDPYAAQFGASPTELIILHVVNNANSGNVTVNFGISLKYHVILFDRVDLSGS